MRKHTPKYPNFLAAARNMKAWKGYKHVAKKLQVRHLETILLWEKGSHMPSAKNLIGLSILYDRRIEDLYPQLVEQLRRQIKK